MAKDKQLVPSSSQQVQAFLKAAASLPATRARAGRLIFALDATASREHLWDQACQIQGDMFAEAGKQGGLQIQLCYFRGRNEFQALSWTPDGEYLAQRMAEVRCQAGMTQIARVLRHALAETARTPVQALVFVGDAVEEAPELLYDLAGKLAIHGVPVFLFQEGSDASVEAVYRRIARLTGGAYAHFDRASSSRLRQLLCAVAVYASGGIKALEHLGRSGNAEVKALTRQLK